MNAEIEKLIDLALADGQITEKERNVILKKAAELGADIDEVEMILDGRLHQLEASKPKQKEKAGNIKTCPACGAHVKAFQIKCDDCGHEYRETKSSVNIKEFHQKIISSPLKERASIIQSFPIPTNKEDIIEFLTIAVAGAAEMTQEEQVGYLNGWKGPNIEWSYREAEIAAWKNKATMGINQANMLFVNDIAMKMILENYQNQLKQNTSKESKKKKKTKIIVLSSVAFIFIAMIILFSGLSSKHDKGIEIEKARLEVIMNKVNDAISKKDYDAALMLVVQLKWEYTDSYSTSDTDQLQNAWDEKREELISEIKKMKTQNN